MGTILIIVLVILLLGGGLWFLLSPEVGKVRIPRSRRSLGAVLRKKPVILATLVGLLLIGQRYAALQRDKAIVATRVNHLRA